MSKSIIQEAISVEIAISLGLTELSVSDRSKVDIEVLEEPKKGLFGVIGNKLAKVKLTLKPDNARDAVNFLKEITLAMGMICEIESKEEDKNIYIEIKGSDVHKLIGKRGATLESLQYITNLAVNKGENSYRNVIIDIENYRERRREALENLANNLGKKVIRTRKSVTLEPMSAYERRIIHVTLQNNPNVKTSSDGREPNRFVVIDYVK